MILAAAIVIALAASGLTAALRVIAQDHGKAEWLLEKPFSCDLCMSFWGSVIFTIAYVLRHPEQLWDAPVLVPASVGAALVFTKAANRLSS